MCPSDNDEANLDLPASLRDKLDTTTIANLYAADPEEIRRVLEQFLPPEEIEGMLRRIAALAAKK